MQYVKQLFEGSPPEWVHLLFTRYGRGLFDGPAAEVEVGKDIKFKTTVEFSTYFGYLAASCGGDFSVEGAIYAKKDIRDGLNSLGIEFDDKSKPKQGFFVAQIKGTYPGDVLARMYDLMPHATVLLQLTGAGVKLKCKKKPPKPGGEKVSDFASGTLGLSVLAKLREDVFFGGGDFKSAKVEYKYQISEIVIPAGMDAAKARLSAKRKGKVLRMLTIDGSETKSECELDV
jgi:hypothetical protein